MKTLTVWSLSSTEGGQWDASTEYTEYSDLGMGVAEVET